LSIDKFLCSPPFLLKKYPIGRKPSVKPALSFLFFPHGVSDTLKFADFFLDLLRSFVDPILNLLLHLLVAEIIDDCGFVELFLLTNFLLDCLVYVGVYHAGVTTDVHLRFELGVLAD
jgi:hypothetical protein